MIQLSVSDRIGAETNSTLKMVSKITCNRLSRQHGFRSHSSLSVVQTTYLGKVVFCPRLVSQFRVATKFDDKSVKKMISQFQDFSDGGRRAV